MSTIRRETWVDRGNPSSNGRRSREPVADGERRIDAGQVPKRIRRAVYRLFERDRKRQLGRAATARRRSPAQGEPLAHPPQRSPGGSPIFHLATGAITP